MTTPVSTTASPSGVGDIWDDVKAQVSQLADQVQSALTPDSWTTATRVLPWVVGGLFVYLAVSGGRGRR